MLPNFMGIGAPKAGTTWLFKCLSEHPEVFVAARKETNFFDYAAIDGRMGEYEEHFATAGDARAIGEVSTRYLTSARAPERIKQYIPGARLFVSLRNPVDQVYSHYWHLSRQNFHQWNGDGAPRTFEEALERYENRLLEPSLYYSHLQRWLDCFDRSQLHIIFYDDIRDRPGEVLMTLFEFLGVDPQFQAPSTTEKGAAVRQGTSPRSPRLGALHSLVYANLNRRVYLPLKGAVGPRIAEEVKNALHIREVMESIFHRKGYPVMQPRTRARLRSQFKEEIRGLENLTGRDLSAWRV